MEGGHRLRTVDLVPLSTVFGDPEVFVYHGLRSRTAETKYDSRLYGLNLSLQVRVTGVDLARPGLAVPYTSALLYGGTALNDIGQVYVLAREIHGLEDVIEQLAGSSDERKPRGILVLSWPLAYEHKGRGGVSDAKDRIGARRSEIALGTDGDLAGQLRKPLLPALSSLNGVKQTIQNSSIFSCPASLFYRSSRSAAVSACIEKSSAIKNRLRVTL